MINHLYPNIASINPTQQKSNINLMSVEMSTRPSARGRQLTLEKGEASYPHTVRGSLGISDDLYLAAWGQWGGRSVGSQWGG